MIEETRTKLSQMLNEHYTLVEGMILKFIKKFCLNTFFIIYDIFIYSDSKNNIVSVKKLKKNRQISRTFFSKRVEMTVKILQNGRPKEFVFTIKRIYLKQWGQNHGDCSYEHINLCCQSLYSGFTVRR